MQGAHRVFDGTVEYGTNRMRRYIIVFKEISSKDNGTWSHAFTCTLGQASFKQQFQISMDPVEGAHRFSQRQGGVYPLRKR